MDTASPPVDIPQVNPPTESHVLTDITNIPVATLPTTTTTTPNIIQPSNGVDPITGSLEIDFNFNKRAPIKQYFYTFNNYTEETRDKLIKYLEEHGKHHVCGREVAPTTGTPHLQGVFTLRKKQRWNLIKDRLHAAIGNKNLSLQVSRNYKAAVKYCKKEGNFYEHGAQPPRSGGHQLDPFKAAVKTGNHSTVELREMYSSCFASYPRFCLDYIADHAPKLPPSSLPGPLRPFQRCLKEYIDGAVNRREILFVVDEVGNNGKSSFAMHCIDNDPLEATEMVEMGKKDNMFYDFTAYEPSKFPTVLFVDCERADAHLMQYGTLVKIKEGRFISHKFHAKRIRYSPPHMVVLMNEHPNYAELSIDRIRVMILDPNITPSPTDPLRGRGFRWQTAEETSALWNESHAKKMERKNKSYPA